LTIVIWIGIDIASGTWILIIFAFILGVISYPSLKAQERTCIDKYGKKYLDYIKKTSRYLMNVCF